MARLLRLIRSQRRQGREYRSTFLPAQVLLSGHTESPLPKPRNPLLGKGSLAIIRVASLARSGPAPSVMGLAVALAMC